MFEILRISFIQNALITGVIFGGFLSFLGVFVVLRRIVFIGIAISQIAATGFVIGLFLGVRPEFVSAGMTIAAITVFSYFLEEKRLSKEALIGFIYTFFSGVSIILLSKSASGETHLADIFSGNILTVGTTEIFYSGLIILLCVVFCLICYRKFLLLAYDIETAGAMGVNTGFYNFLFFLILGVSISTAMRFTGILLTFGYLIIPALTGMVLSEKIKNVFIASISFGMLATFIGIYSSYKLDLPTGPAIILFLGILFILSILWDLIRKNI